MKFLAVTSWALIGRQCRLYTSGEGKVYFGSSHLVFFTSPFRWLLDFIQTPRLTVSSPVFLFWVLRVVVGKLLSGLAAVSWPNIGAAPQFFLIRQILLCGVVRLTQFFYSTLQRVYSIFLDTSSSTLWRCSSNSILLLTSVSESAQLRQRVCSTPTAGPSIFAYLPCEESRQWVLSFCILREEFHYILLCTLFKNVTVSCIKSLCYTVDSGLCITLQLWNTVSRCNPVIMHCRTFWKE